jgi:hypothetical protein
VSNSRAWPFTPGSGNNSRYNGDDVIQLVLNLGDLRYRLGMVLVLVMGSATLARVL